MSDHWDAGTLSRMWVAKQTTATLKQTDVHSLSWDNFCKCFCFCFVQSLPTQGMRMACQPVRITSYHALWLWRTGDSKGTRGRRRDEPSEGLGGQDKEGKRILTQNQTPCGKRGTYCSLGQKRRGRRRSHWQTWISAGTVYGPPCLTGRPRKRLQTSFPDTQCYLERQGDRQRTTETISAIWSQLFVSENAEWVKHILHSCMYSPCAHSEALKRKSQRK